MPDDVGAGEVELHCRYGLVRPDHLEHRDVVGQSAAGDGEDVGLAGSGERVRDRGVGEVVVDALVGKPLGVHARYAVALPGSGEGVAVLLLQGGGLGEHGAGGGRSDLGESVGGAGAGPGRVEDAGGEGDLAVADCG